MGFSSKPLFQIISTVDKRIREFQVTLLDGLNANADVDLFPHFPMQQLS